MRQKNHHGKKRHPEHYPLETEFTKLDTLENLDQKQQLAVISLCEQLSISKAAEVSNISRSQLYNYLAMPEF